MRIVHFSVTRLAGAPIRLVQALQAHSPHDVRLVDAERWDQFEHDLVFEESVDEVVELCESADVIHLHNYLDYESTDFRPVDFSALRDRGKAFVRHFHSTPETIAQHVGTTVGDVLSSPIPSLVMAGHQERYYPQAHVVRIVIPQDDPLYRPSEERDGIAFTPTMPTSAWAERWNTKGTPEVLEMLRKVERETGCTIRVIQGRPVGEALEEKRRSLVVVDDLVTGSYHTSGLEGLSMGRPVLGHIDERIRLVLSEVSGSPICPFVDVRLEDATVVLAHLVRHPDDAADLGRESRAWIEAHWADRQLVQDYVGVYKTLLENPEAVGRQAALRIDEQTRFSSIVLPDLLYEARRRRALAARPLHVKAAERAGQAYRRLPLRWRLGARRLLGRPT